MGLVYLVFFFILGLAAGSFVNAAVYRLRYKLPLLMARSQCPECKHPLSPLELIPLLSFALQRGKCRHCGGKISVQYPLVELAAGAMFAYSYYYFFGLNALHFDPINLAAMIARLVFITILLILFIYDLKYMELPDNVVLWGIVIAVVADLVQMGLSYWQLYSLTHSSILGKYLDQSYINQNFSLAVTPYLYGLAAGAALALVFYLIVLLSRERAMGGGDIKLALLLGLMLPWPYLVPALYVGFFLGAIVGIGVLLIRRGKLGTLIPLAPFLITGVFASMFFGGDLTQILITFKPF